MSVWGSAANATGIGSMPGTDPAAALASVVEAVPDFPFWPELPAVGPHRGMVGRAAGLVLELPMQLRSGRWTTTSRPGIDQVRARQAFEEDLVLLTSLLAGAELPLKVGVCGPWTLLAQVESASGRALVTDSGAARDVVDSLAAGIDALKARLAETAPGLGFVLQLDEPMLPAVLSGRLSSEGWGRLPAVSSDDVVAGLSAVLDGASEAVVHCCAPDPPLEQIWSAGATGVSVDLAILGEAKDDQLGTGLEAGRVLLAGVVEPLGPSDPLGSVDSVPERSELTHLTRLLGRLGIAPSAVADQVVITPTCGLAGASVRSAADVLKRCRRLAVEFAGHVAETA